MLELYRTRQNMAIVIIIGIIALAIIASSWSNALGEIDFGTVRYNPDYAESQRASINTTYGVWFFIVLIGTVALAYVLNPATKKTTEQEQTSQETHHSNNEKEDEEKQLRAELEELKEKLKELDDKTKN